MFTCSVLSLHADSKAVFGFVQISFCFVLKNDCFCHATKSVFYDVVIGSFVYLMLLFFVFVLFGLVWVFFGIGIKKQNKYQNKSSIYNQSNIAKVLLLDKQHKSILILKVYI